MKHRITIGSSELVAFLALATMAIAQTSGSQSSAAVPKNLGLGLREIAVAYQNAAGPTGLSTDQIRALVKSQCSAAQVDKNGRLLVDVYLDGTQSVPAMEASLTSVLNMQVIAAVDWYRKGVISGWIPVANAAPLGTTSGVRAARVAPRMMLNSTHHAVMTGATGGSPAQTALPAIATGVGAVPQGGVAQSQGKIVLHADKLNALGYDGSGGKDALTGAALHPITIAALSDSFSDTAPQSGGTTTPPLGIPDNYAFDILNDDLPGPGNPNFHLTPVDVVEEDPEAVPDVTATDEGRGMLQVIHDIAPYANLAFATAEGTETNFANNIIALGSPTSVMVPVFDPNTQQITNRPGAGAQVIADDVSYIAEPIFSDGLIAQAIDFVATNYGVHYFSSAGNDGNAGYVRAFKPINARTVYTKQINPTTHRLMTPNGPPQGLDFSFTTGANASGIPPTAYSGGFHSFGPDASGNPTIVQHITTGSIGPYIVLQWDDPYDDTLQAGLGEPTNSAGITTNYNLLVFDSDGTFDTSLSSTFDAFSTNQPIQFTGNTGNAATDYYIVITRDVSVDPNYKGPTDPSQANYVPPPLPAARNLRMVYPSDGGGITGDFIFNNSPETYGHNCATNASGVGAYVYDAIPNILNDPKHVFTPMIEGYSSNGPVAIYFDAQGNRLTTGITRNRPLFSAIDGGDTSFFPPPGIGTILVPPGGPVLPIEPPVGGPTSSNPNDYDNNGYPNFFGTSEAAPHAAAVCALLIDAAFQKNLPTISPDSMRSLLSSNTQLKKDLAPDFISAATSATGPSGTAKVRLSGQGSDPNSPFTFKVQFVAGSGTQQLTSLVFDLTGCNQVWDDDPTEFPLTQGPHSGSVTITGHTLSNNPPGESTNLTGSIAQISFANFNPTDYTFFGWDHDIKITDLYGNSVDQLQGATFTATITDTSTVPATTFVAHGNLANQYGKGYNFKAGYGLIDATAALHALGL